MKFRGFVLAVGLASIVPVCASGQTLGAPQTVVIQNGTLALRALLWLPSGRGPFPAVLFNHGSGPSTDLNKPAILGAAFARHGYAFLYVFRRGAGLSGDQGTNSEDVMARAVAEGGQERRNEVQLQLLETELSDVVAGLTYLSSRSDVDRLRVSIGGHSFGGQLTLLLTAREPTVRAAIVFGAAAASWEPSPKLRERLLAAVRAIDVPVFFIHAANDFSISPGTVLAAEMKRLGKPHRVMIYPPVGQTPAEGHDFVHLGVSTWEPDVFAFLDDRR
jgi:pimeloyl-ACP methyl ester carboxylesterase